MSASFKKNDRVRLSPLGLRNFPQRRGVLATVTGDLKDPTQVRVRFDGFASRETFAALFFEGADDVAAPTVTKAKDGVSCK